MRISWSPRTQGVFVVLFLGVGLIAMRAMPQDSRRVSEDWQTLSHEAREWVMPSRDTIAQYERASELLEQRRDAEAVAQLARARAGDLVLHGVETRGELPEKALVPTALLIQLGRTIGKRAEGSAERNDLEGSEKWIRRGRNIAGQVLNTPYATMEALTLARSLDAVMDRAEIRIQERAGSRLALSVQMRSTTMGQFWRARILKPIQEMIVQRDDEQHETCQRSGADTCEENLQTLLVRWADEDHRFAQRLIALYAQERTRLLAVAL